MISVKDIFILGDVIDSLCSPHFLQSINNFEENEWEEITRVKYFILLLYAILGLKQTVSRIGNGEKLFQ